MSELIFLGRRSKYKLGMQKAFCEASKAKILHNRIDDKQVLMYNAGEDVDKISSPIQLEYWLKGQKIKFNLATYGIPTRSPSLVASCGCWQTPFDQTAASYKKLLLMAENFIYIDHGYFCKSSGPQTWDGYFNFTANARAFNEKTDHSWDRFNSLGIKLKDWRKKGDHIVLIPPSIHCQEYLKTSPEIEDALKLCAYTSWAKETVTELKKYTDRPILFSSKADRPIMTCLKDAWCVVTDHSNGALLSMIEGIPAIFTNHYRKLGSLSDIENPPMDRGFFKGLAHNQWNIDEVERGKMWGELTERHPFLK